MAFLQYIPWYIFGLKIHFGIRSEGKTSKTEAMFVPGAQNFMSLPGQKPEYTKYEDIQAEIIADIELDDSYTNTSHISFTSHFKYLGSYISRDLDDAYNIKNISAVPRRSLVWKRPTSTLTVRFPSNYAYAVKVLLWGCE